MEEAKDPNVVADASLRKWFLGLCVSLRLAQSGNASICVTNDPPRLLRSEEPAPDPESRSKPLQRLLSLALGPSHRRCRHSAPWKRRQRAATRRVCESTVENVEVLPAVGRRGESGRRGRRERLRPGVHVERREERRVRQTSCSRCAREEQVEEVVLIRATYSLEFPQSVPAA